MGSGEPDFDTPVHIKDSPGGKLVICNAFVASLNPNDEVVIPTPCWVSYPDMVKLAGDVSAFAKAKLKDGHA